MAFRQEVIDISMFQFNFHENKQSNTIKDTLINWIDSSEIIVNDTLLADIQPILNNELKTIKFNNFNFNQIDMKSIMKIIETDSNYSLIKNVESKHSDLIPGIYEGGLKIWECTIDLLQYLQNHQEISLNGTTVLDLGCGNGCVGIYALKCNASVHFQDYNAEVLKLITIPNTIANAKECLKNSRYFNGDWESFSKLIKDDGQTYDYIMTCETIYNVENYNKLISLFQTCLKRDGIVLLAAKRYYFGVGGGIDQFLKMLTETDAFQYEICWRNTNGVHRQIVKITRK